MYHEAVILMAVITATGIAVTSMIEKYLDYKIKCLEKRNALYELETHRIEIHLQVLSNLSRALETADPISAKLLIAHCSSEIKKIEDHKKLIDTYAER